MHAQPTGAEPCRLPRTPAPASPRLRAAVALVLAAAASRPAALTAQSAPIVVVANRSLRPTAVLQPHVRFVVAADSNDERLLIRDLGIPPVTFAGVIRVEGIQPGARSFEARPWPDTLVFERDGRVLMRLADHAERPPISVEVIGARSAIGGRIVITAPGMPPGRALLVSVGPADIYETAFRSAGYGQRDRMRIEQRDGMAYLTDAEAGPTTVAIGFGRGTTGRIQEDGADVVIARDFGGSEGRERRQLGALLMAIDPVRGDDGVARAEIIFGVGNNEGQAADAARDAAAEAPLTPSVPSLRISTPSTQVNLLLRHVFAAAGWMLNWDVLNGERTVVASASRPVVRIRDAWLGSVVALQRGDTAAVCGSYRLVRRASGTGQTRVEVAPRLGARGRFLAASDSADAGADAAAVLLAHACYQANRSEPFLRAELPFLSGAAARAAREAPGAFSADALERLAELDDELVRLAGAPATGRGDSLRGEAERLSPSTSAPPSDALWRMITGEALRGLNRDYGRLSSGASGEGGVSLTTAGTFLDLLGGELFGITEALDRVGVAPALDGIADDFSWQLDGWLLGGGDTLGITYRPADRQAVVRLSASRRRRLVLKFPWLTADACVTVRRGDDIERLRPVAQADGTLYVDIRATFDRAEITVVPVACVG